MQDARPHMYVVEDDTELRRFYADVAESSGWRVTECSDGNALLDALGSEQGKAMLLIDIHLPGLDGIDVIDHLGQWADRLRIRFITGGEPSHILAANLIATARSMHVGRNIFKPIAAKALSETFGIERELVAQLRPSMSAPSL